MKLGTKVDNESNIKKKRLESQTQTQNGSSLLKLMTSSKNEYISIGSSQDPIKHLGQVPKRLESSQNV